MKVKPDENRRICEPNTPGDNIKIDPEFENLIPPLSKNELAELQQSLKTHGCRDALIVWKNENILVDGHNRLRFCRDNNVLFPVIEKEFTSREEVRSCIITDQLGRRNLSPSAESYLRGKRYLATKHQGTRSDLTSGQGDQKTAAEQLGEVFKVGEKTIRRDAKFAEDVDRIVEKCGADTRNLLLSRDMGLTRGMVSRIATLCSEEQIVYLRFLKESGRRPRNSAKDKKREKFKQIRVPTQPKALVQTLLARLGTKELDDVARILGEAMAMRELDKEDSEKKKTRGKTRKKN